jgi:anti-sigma factor RsiW
MACSEKEYLLHGHFDGELDLLSSLEMEEHLKTCDDCAQEFRDQQTLRGALHCEGLYEPAPRGLQTRIRTALQVKGSARPASLRHPAIPWLALAAAIAIVALVGLRILSDTQSRSSDDLVAQEVVESHVRSLQLGHLMDVPSTDQHTVKPWFDGKIDFAPPVTDLAPQGFPLIGGRLDYLDHRNVAALIYQRRKHVINVFIWPDQVGSDQPPRTEMMDGYRLIHWQQNTMEFWAISDVSQDDENQLAALLRQ